MDERKRVLIVDDEQAITELIKAYLHGTSRFLVETVNDSSTAVAVARHFRPNIVLLDLMMPKMDGSDVVAQMQQDPALRGVPVVFLTGAVQEDEIAESNGFVGGNFFIAKPVSLEKLVLAIDKYAR